ncbi:hypothetical protein GBAR_LOCUS17275, partial [Geodia barretti]
MFLEDGESVCTDISNRVNNHLIPNRSLLRYRYSDLHSKKILKTHYLSPNSLNHLPSHSNHSLSSHTHNNCQLFSSRSLSSASLSSRS